MKIDFISLGQKLLITLFNITISNYITIYAYPNMSSFY